MEYLVSGLFTITTPKGYGQVLSNRDLMRGVRVQCTCSIVNKSEKTLPLSAIAFSLHEWGPTPRGGGSAGIGWSWPDEEIKDLEPGATYKRTITLEPFVIGVLELEAKLTFVEARPADILNVEAPRSPARPNTFGQFLYCVDPHIVELRRDLAKLISQKDAETQ